jgi:hypothetical protein
MPGPSVAATFPADSPHRLGRPFSAFVFDERSARIRGRAQTSGGFLPTRLAMTTPDLTFVQRPQGVAPPLGAYSHLAIVPGGARLLVLAGQTGHATDGSLSADAG